MLVCGACKAEMPDEARFCHACGSPLARRPPERTRRTVTILFTDVVGSTTLGEQLDPEVIADVMTEYFDVVRPVVERHGGALAKFLGDAVLAVYGIPVVREDDALRAVRTAAELVDVLGELNARLDQRYGITLATRTGVHTGRVASAGSVPDQDFVGGDTSNTAARLQSHAEPDGVLLSEATYRLVRDAVVAERLEPLALKGKAEPVPVYRLVEVLSQQRLRQVRSDVPLVGRDDDLERLRTALTSVLQRRRCGVLTVVGQPGVGKSRIVRELLVEVERTATIAVGRCPPYGDGIAYWPVAEALRQACGIAEDDTAETVRAKLGDAVGEAPDADLVIERVAQVLGLSDVAAVAEEIVWAVRRLLEELARRRPLVLVIDDIHLAQPSLVSLVDHLAANVTAVPLCVVCMARPELLEQRPGWGTAQELGTLVVLEPLDAVETGVLVSELLGGGLPPGALGRVVAAAAGNPLFLEHLVAMLVDDGVLTERAGEWVVTGDLEHLPVPPTVQAVIATRLERLDHDERRVLGRAAVVGQAFDARAVVALAPDELGPRVEALLAALVARDLVETTAQEPGHRFRHVLIRDVAYQSLGKHVRAELHERHASWLERETAAGDELLGFHLEQAHAYRAQLGAPDDATRALAARAAARLGSAERRALARGDMQATAGLATRVLELLPPDDPSRARLLVDRGDALQLTGRFAEADAVFAEALERASAAGDRGAEATARVARAWLGPSVDPDASFDAVVAVVLPALDVLEGIGDDAGAARAARVAMWARGSLGRFGDARAFAERAIEHGLRAGDPRVAFDRATLVSCLFYGPIPAVEAEARAVALLDQVRDSPAAEANLLIRLGMLQAIQGRIDEGEATVREGAAAVTALGLHIVGIVNAALGLGYVQLLRGDWAAAERELRPCYETLAPLGETSFLSGNAARLATALVELDRLDEADAFVDVAASTATDDDVFTQVLWRLARARMLVAREPDAAVRLAEEAVARARATDVPELQGDALLGLARVRAETRALPASREAAAAARARYAAKGHAVATARAEALLESLAPSGGGLGDPARA